MGHGVSVGCQSAIGSHSVTRVPIGDGAAMGHRGAIGCCGAPGRGAAMGCGISIGHRTSTRCRGAARHGVSVGRRAAMRRHDATGHGVRVPVGCRGAMGHGAAMGHGGSLRGTGGALVLSPPQPTAPQQLLQLPALCGCGEGGSPGGALRRQPFGRGGVRIPRGAPGGPPVPHEEALVLRPPRLRQVCGNTAPSGGGGGGRGGGDPRGSGSFCGGVP